MVVLIPITLGWAMMTLAIYTTYGTPKTFGGLCVLVGMSLAVGALNVGFWTIATR